MCTCYVIKPVSVLDIKNIHGAIFLKWIAAAPTQKSGVGTAFLVSNNLTLPFALLRAAEATG